MTLYCLDCGSDRVYDTNEPWRLNKIPVCPHCSAPLRDELGKPLTPSAEKGWCHAPHRSSGFTPYLKQNWLWRDADNYPDAAVPAGEAAEMAAHREIPDDGPLEDR